MRSTGLGSSSKYLLPQTAINTTRMSLPRTLRASLSSALFLPRVLAPRHIPLTCRRHKSGPYGYTQAKALVYSKYGEPSDVLSYGPPFHFPLDPFYLAIANCSIKLHPQAPHPFNISLSPAINRPPPRPRHPHKPRRHKPNPRHVPLAAALHLSPRHAAT